MSEFSLRKAGQAVRTMPNTPLISEATLNIITLIIAGIIITLIFIFGKRRVQDEVTPKTKNESEKSNGWEKVKGIIRGHSYKIYFSLFILGFSAVLITSYHVVYYPPAPHNIAGLLLSYLKERSIVLLILVLTKTFLIYLLVFAITGIFTMDRLQKFSVEVLGMKFAAERTKEEKAVDLSKRVSDNIEAMKRFNDATARYVSSEFESEILDIDPRQTAMNIRDKIEELLKEAYGEFDRLSIKVLPATPAAVNRLKDPAKQVVKPVFDRTVFLRDDQIGVVAYNQVKDYETLVVIDATESAYDLNDSEVYGIALFVGSFINILAWAGWHNLS